MKKSAMIWLIGAIAVVLVGVQPIQICRADDGVTIFNNQEQFVNATGAVVVPIPPSGDSEGVMCDKSESAQIDISFDSNMITITQDLTAPGNISVGMCIFDKDIDRGEKNTNPSVMIANTIAGNGEDDYLMVFDNPVHAVGFRLLTNDQANEIVTLKDASDNVISIEDIDALTGKNTRQFVGFQSVTPIKSVLIDTFEGWRQNECIDEIKVAQVPTHTEVDIDIKPQSCPNPLNVKSKGVLPVAIFGTPDFDVEEIDPASLRLLGVAPLRSALEDVGGPEDAENCYYYGLDGWVDLTLKFKTQYIVAAIGAVTDGDEVVLPLTGNLKEEFGGTPIEGEDVVIILKKGKK